MARVISKLSIQVGANSATLTKDFGRMQRTTKQAADGVAAAGRSAGKYTDQARRAAGATGSLADQARAAAKKFAAFALVLGGLGLAAKLAAGAETTATQFKVMLGDAQKAKAVIEQLKAYTAGTPFAEQDVNAAAKTLLGYETAAGDLLGQLRMLGDIAAGSGAQLADLARIFGRVQQAGVATLEDINQLSDRQIPIMSALAAQYGVGTAELKKMISAGKVGFAEVLAALQQMTSEGGVFFNATSELSETLAGRISTLKDNFRALAIAVGEKMLPALKAMADTGLAVAQAIGKIDAGAVMSAVRIVAFAGAFAAGVAAAGFFVATAAKVVVALKNITKAGAMLQATTGIGIAKVLIGLAAGAAAVYAIDQSFSEMETSGTNTAAAMDKVAAASEKAAAGAAKPAAAAKQAAEAAGAAADEAAKKQEDWMRRGAALADSVRTPVEQLADKMQEFRDALAAGAITGDTFGRLAAKAADEYERADEAARRIESRAPKAVGAAVYGTTAGAAAIEAARRSAALQAEQQKARDAENGRRDKLLADLVAGTKSVEQAVRDSRQTVRQSRI